MRIELTKLMKEAVEFFKDLDQTFFVGGCVRDAVLGLEVKDVDLITKHSPEEIEAFIKSKGRRAFLQGKRFGSIGVKLDGIKVEVTTYRKEIYDFVSRKPKVEFSDKIEDDLSRRDFTINTLVADFEGNVKNYHNGLDDLLKNKVLKAVGTPKLRFKEDPLRIMRAIRFAHKYNLAFDSKTLSSLEHNKYEMLRLSKERIVEEMHKLFELSSEKLGQALLLMFEKKIFEVLIPSLQLQYNMNQENPHHQFPLHLHTINVVKAVREDFTEFDRLWSALFHDIGKPYTKVKAKNGDYYNYINHEELGAEMANNFCIVHHFSNEMRKFIVETIKEHREEKCWLKKYDDAHKREVNMNEPNQVIS